MRLLLKYIINPVKMVAFLSVYTDDVTVVSKDGRNESYYCGEWDLESGAWTVNIHCPESEGLEAQNGKS